MKKRKGLTIFSIVLVVLLVVVLFYYFGATHPQYAAMAKESIDIVGLNDGFTPQGITFDNESDNFIISGYMKDEKQPSRLYIVDESGEYHYVTLVQGDKDYFGHAGGVAVYRDWVYVAGDGMVFEINKEDIINSENSQAVEVAYSFETQNGADSVTVRGNELWVGEFYKKDVYDTDETHHITNNNGETNYAVALCYELDECGLITNKPYKGLSMPNQVQGFEFFEDDSIILSTSYGLPDSKFYIFENIFDQQPIETLNIEGQSVPVYGLFSDGCAATFNAPCMSEEVVIVDNNLYILYESACNKYKFVTRTRVKKLHYIEIQQLINAGE